MMKIVDVFKKKIVDCKKKSDILKVVFIILGNGGPTHENKN